MPGMNGETLRLGGIVLDLVMPGDRRPPNLGKADWDAVDEIAFQHRLTPLLYHHAKARGARLPQGLEERWREAAHRSTLSVLLARRDLLDCLARLNAIDVTPMLLKGGHLAFEHYPQPGLRPLRDVDLLLPADRAVAAFRLLCEQGYRQTIEGDVEAFARQHHQLPTLEAPGGTPVDLHVRLSIGSAAGDGPSFDPFDHARRVRLGDQAMLVPSPELMMTHLAAHAAYHHRFDNGPLTLSDFAYLLGQDVDWPMFERLSAPYAAGTRLIFGLLERHGFALPAEAKAVKDEDALDAATYLMVQDLDGRDAARISPASHRSLFRLLFPKRERLAFLYGETAWQHPWRARWRHWRRLVTSRLPVLLKSRASGDARATGAVDRFYRDWIAGKEN